jgi:predicted component of type VI protein secretion system
LVIGRDPICDIVINDPEVSRQHARLTRISTGYQLEDLGSTNGTFVNGARLASEIIILKSGQSVGMGSGVRLNYEQLMEDDGIETMVDSASYWADEAEESAKPAPPPSQPAPPIANWSTMESVNPVYEPSPSAAPPLVPTQEGSSNKRNRNIAIALASLLLLCCCCLLFTLFMYQIGGDWLLEYFNLYP